MRERRGEGEEENKEKKRRNKFTHLSPAKKIECIIFAK